MQFTPQQLVGAGRYAPATRIGNWNEDLMLEEARMREFQLRKKQGSLLASHKLKLEFLHAKAPRSFDSQQRVTFGQAVGVRHLASSAQLACNTFEETPSIGSGEFLVTALSSSTATARSTFRIVSPATLKSAGREGLDLRAGSGQPLNYGDPFFLACNEALLVDDASVLLRPPLLLHSAIKSDRSMSPVTSNQRVWLGAEPDSGALWVCQRADLTATDKLLADGTPVRAGDTMAIVHKMTGQPLRADGGSKLPTDFGVELEVCAVAARAAGKLHHLAAEAEGTRTADTEGRTALPANVWTFELAASSAEAKDDRVLPDPPSPANVFAVIQQCLATASLYAFRRFVVALKALDRRGTGHLEREPVKFLLLREYQLPLRGEQLDLALDAFDKRNAGFFPTDELLKAVRPPISSRRADLVDAAFARLAGGAASLSLSELVGKYDPTIDARVHGELLTAAQATTEYRELWLPSTPDTVSRREFADVYADVSVAVANDAHFAQLLEESWK